MRTVLRLLPLGESRLQAARTPKLSTLPVLGPPPNSEHEHEQSKTAPNRTVGRSSGLTRHGRRQWGTRVATVVKGGSVTPAWLRAKVPIRKSTK